LIRDVLLPALEAKLKSPTANRQSAMPKASDRIESEDEKEDEDNSSLTTHYASRISGHESLAQVVLVDQSALGKTPRSNPAVYIGAFDDIREVFAQSEVAKQRGLNASAFSFNSSVGQCEKCRGAGFEKIEMQFLSDIFIRCPDCNGRRYRQHILEVKVSGARDQVSGQRSKPRLTPDTPHLAPAWSIGDMLEATVDEAIEFLALFAYSKPAARAGESLKLLQEVGLGYLRLGQPINTLSGGESQRLKLVRHLSEATQTNGAASGKVGKWKNESATSPLPTFSPAHFQETGKGASETSRQTLFLFDEPTTGLHFDDVRVLLKVFQRLVDAGHSVVVIEHNLDVIKCADWLIDLGPEAGDGGGQIVAQGTPEDIVSCAASHTGHALKSVLNQPTQGKT
jgi:excinuclease ABC subunit A